MPKKKQEDIECPICELFSRAKDSETSQAPEQCQARNASGVKIDHRSRARKFGY